MDNDAFVRSFDHYFSYGTWFKDFNPVCKMVFCLCLGFTCFMSYTWQYGLAMVAICYVLAASCGELGEFNKVASKLFVFLLLFMIVIREGSIQGKTVIFSIFGWKWTVEALLNGMNVGATFLGFSCWIVLFFYTTPMRDLTFCLERMGLGHETSYVVLASMQSITDLRKQSNVIMESQKARGIETEGNAFARMKALVPVLSPVLLGAMSSTEEKTLAMEARAFSAKTQHTFLRELPPAKVAHKALAVLAAIYLVGTIILHAMGLNPIAGI